MIKLSGEALGVNGQLFDYEAFQCTAKSLAALQAKGFELAVVIGGGNVWRGRRGRPWRWCAVAADQMGMLATLQNAIMMQTPYRPWGRGRRDERGGYPPLCRPFQAAKAKRMLSEGTILQLAAVRQPILLTDTAARCARWSWTAADFDGKERDGVYDMDPTEHPGAAVIDSISYGELPGKAAARHRPERADFARDNRFPVCAYSSSTRRAKTSKGARRRSDGDDHDPVVQGKTRIQFPARLRPNTFRLAFPRRFPRRYLHGNR
jgi:uridylate kinase